MKFRLEWIGQYLPGELPDLETLRRRLTDVGFIVEGTEGEGREAVLDVELTANRPDGMNHRGLAREAACALGREFRDVPAPTPAEGPVDAAALATVAIEEPALCSRYSARIVEGIRVREASPALQERLRALGMNPISAPVDATNHVLWDIGQPTHAFDLDTLAKGPDGRPAIVVRRARSGETLVTLDGVERTLSPEHLVIADAERPVALAGVMGGLHTAITPSTTRVLIESAHFSATAVRKTARLLGMHTDASHRFERGADPATTVEGLNRVTALLVAGCGGTVAHGVIDVLARAIPPKVVKLRHARLVSFLGMDVPFARAVEILSALAFGVKETEPGVLAVTVPSWRIDVEQECDLIEEVIRVVGYGALPEALPPPFNPTWSEPILAREDRARDVLAAAGFVEACSYSFVSAEENAPFASAVSGSAPVIANALGEPFTTMRATPVIGLLRSARHNVRRGHADLALFEVGRSYALVEGRPVESRRAAVLLHGRRGTHWAAASRPADFYDGSGAVAALYAGFGAGAPQIRPASFPFLAPGRSAEVVAGGTVVGWVGVLAGPLASSWDLGEAVVADVDVAAIPASPPPSTVEMPSRFPGSEVDLTVTHPLSVAWEALESAVRRDAPGELLRVDTKYLWRGAGVPEGFVKTTLTVAYGSQERSLGRDEINRWRDEAARRLLLVPGAAVDGIA
ncbi:MAG: phenylalanine--tRNA ligase subunit beta [Holophagales bacterium]|nr:phenylalanine--tRNA ligase subunit beta [Holophagales bacterium]